MLTAEFRFAELFHFLQFAVLSKESLLPAQLYSENASAFMELIVLLLILLSLFFLNRNLMKTMFMCSKAQRKFITLRNNTLHK